MQIRFIAAARLLLPALISVQAVPQVVAPTAVLYEDDEAYQVYAAALSSLTGGATVNFIQERTVSGDRCIVPSGELAEQVREAAEDRLRLGLQQFRLSNRFTLPGQLLNDLEVKQVGNGIARHEDEKFDRANLITLSPVGFSEDRTVAVVFVGRYCGQLCGNWSSSAFFKSNGRWSLIKGQTKCSTVS